jgi:hypothetical protein
VLDLVLALRREIPGLGTRKLYLLLQEPLAVSGIKMGRDKLHQLLQTHDLILRRKRLVPKTTNSAHSQRKYSNLLADIMLRAPQQKPLALSSRASIITTLAPPYALRAFHTGCCPHQCRALV